MTKWEKSASLESDFETQFADYLERRGWFVEKIMRAGRRGFPDRFCARKGVIILAEVKRESPSEPEARMQQQKRHRDLRKAGVRVEVVNNMEQARAIFE